MSTKKNTGARGRQDWATPAWLFDALNERFGPFDVDLCAEPWSAKCGLYVTREMDSLAQHWGGLVGFCNPPFGDRAQPIAKWLEKGWRAATEGESRVVFVLPAATDTAWFHEWAMRGSIYLLRGRVNFDPPEGVVNDSGNNGGTMIVVFDSRPTHSRQEIQTWTIER